MEFVEGETLESLVKRSGCLEVKLAAGNCDAGHRRFGRDRRTTPGPPGYKTNKHHRKIE